MEVCDNRTKKEFISYEEQLLKDDVRNNPDRIAELVADKCIEISEIGTKTEYHHGASYGQTDGVLYITSDAVQLFALSDDYKLLIYKVEKVKGNHRTKATCSSIWQLQDGKWKVVFHQRSLCVK